MHERHASASRPLRRPHREPRRREHRPGDGIAIDCQIEKLYYGDFLAVRDSHVPIEKGKITAFIGPSGCGKSTVLRCLNRMNDLVRGFRFEGHVHFRGQDIYAKSIDPVVVRRHIGMVFQQPNPFAMSIFDNVAFGLRLNRYKGNIAEQVEQALRRAALWDEVKDKLQERAACRCPAASSSGCASPAPSPPSPRVLLMDEPCSALDPIATRRIEELMLELKKRLHDRDRDAQPAAGEARRRQDRVLLGRHLAGRAHRLPGRDGRHQADLRGSARAADQGIYQRPVQLSRRSTAMTSLQRRRGPGAQEPRPWPSDCQLGGVRARSPRCRSKVPVLPSRHRSMPPGSPHFVRPIRTSRSPTMRSAAARASGA